MAKPKGAASPSPSGVSQKRVAPTPRPSASHTEEVATFPIVGIGASAGGLAAFEAFFAAMPTEGAPDMAFVLVQHLAPDHKSILTELIQRYTEMQVYEVEGGMIVRPNCAYIIPPNRDMALLNGTLQLLEPTAPRGQRLPIDYFFRSLADDQHERAICIVLSGTGSDGTLGMRAIKGEGGMAMAQSPESTEFDGMPSSAIATGLVDYVLEPAEMPAQLIAYVERAFVTDQHQIPSASPQGDAELQKIFALLRMHTGNDFSLYKQSTIIRRIERRMAVNQIERLDDYARYLQREPAQIDALFQDLLIGVTSFFRDPSVFESLEQLALPQLLATKSQGDSLRVWVPACSTGEEAYSIAILIQEQMDAMKLSLDVKIFATDIDTRSIERARAGVYPANISADVSAQRLKRYFTRGTDESAYRVQKAIRDMLIFSEQNVIKDPPFSRLDFISCRNLLIYLRGSLQKKLIPLFHYALNQDGLLVVGTSESLGSFDDLFGVLDGKAKIYRRKDPAVVPQWPANSASSRYRGGDEVAQRPSKPKATPLSLREITERELLRRYEPVALLVNARGEILYLHGRTGLYLEPSPGEPGMNVLKMAREGLRLDLATALRKAATQADPATCSGLRVKTNGDYTATDLTVFRITEPDSVGPAGSQMYLIVLEPAQRPAEPILPVVADDASEGPTSEARILQLKQELQSKEEYLQTALEEMETSNEELQSTNEEMQSTNEELQSVNEELETSKEELQSVNEELATVNTELQQRVADLSRANNDMNNLLAGTGVGTLFVDNHLRIQRFTPATSDIINLIESDVGRPLGHIVSNLVGYDTLVEDVQSVLDTLETREEEVQTREREWYLLRIRPYRTTENVIDGAVVTFTEVTELKLAQQAALAAQAESRRLAVVVSDANDAVLVYALDGTIQAWNASATKLYGWTEAEALSMSVGDITPETERERGLALVEGMKQVETIEPFRTQRLTKDGRLLDIMLSATALVDEQRQPYAIATTEREIHADDKADS